MACIREAIPHATCVIYVGVHMYLCKCIFMCICVSMYLCDKCRCICVSV